MTKEIKEKANDWIRNQILQIKKEIMTNMNECVAKHSAMSNCNIALEYLDSIKDIPYEEREKKAIEYSNICCGYKADDLKHADIKYAYLNGLSEALD